MKNEQFEKDIEVVPSIYSGLSIVEDANERFLKGELPIIDANGKFWEKYQIEIKGSGSYPLCFPKLFETADAFPHNADWHVYESDESCCVDIPNNEIIICKSGLNVTDYIKRFAIPYFANQTFRIREGYYLYGEYSHGIFGKIEYYQSKLKANSPQQLIQMFDFIIRGVRLERTAMCPFCHKSKFRKCHRSAFMELSQTKWLMALDGMEQLIPFFAAHPDYQLPRA
jgi:hypothetical protein